MIIELIGENDPYLREVPEEYTFEKSMEYEPEELKNILIENMKHYDGYGLSANQLGIPYKVFALIKDGDPIICFNPEVKEYSEETNYVKEGCLTFPGLWFAVERASGVSVMYYDENGEGKYGIFGGLSARIFQHEMEHMDGELFTDNVSDLRLSLAKKKRKIYLRRMKRNVKKQQKVY
tara:strand:+ start:246 stop:779 length:534 start_codon:yes stop_codon:yes gene_type:complete